MITIAVVENNPRHLNITLQHINSQPQYHVLVTANNGFEMLRYCYGNKQLPDIVLVDIEMQVMDGISLIDFLTRFFPSIKCIVCTSHDHKEIFEDAICCGAMGIISKIYIAGQGEFIIPKLQLTRFGGIDECIESAMNNTFCIDARMKILAKNFLHEIDREQLLALRDKEITTNGVFNLTYTEWEVAALCSGSTATIDDIAHILSIAPKTLQARLAVIYQKLGITNRMELIRFCSSKSLVKYARELLGKECKY